MNQWFSASFVLTQDTIQDGFRQLTATVTGAEGEFARQFIQLIAMDSPP